MGHLWLSRLEEFPSEGNACFSAAANDLTDDLTMLLFGGSRRHIAQTFKHSRMPRRSSQTASQSSLLGGQSGNKVSSPRTIRNTGFPFVFYNCRAVSERPSNPTRHGSIALPFHETNYSIPLSIGSITRPPEGAASGLSAAGPAAVRTSTHAGPGTSIPTRRPGQTA